MLIALFQILGNKLTSSDYWIMGGIQFFLFITFLLMIGYICKLVKEKDPEKSVKKTCILVWFLSAIAWFIIAQIVWIITSIQFSSS
jgi:hypothetical protein